MNEMMVGCKMKRYSLTKTPGNGEIKAVGKDGERWEDAGWEMVPYSNNESVRCIQRRDTTGEGS